MPVTLDKSDTSHEEDKTTAEMLAVQNADTPAGYFPVTPEERMMNRKVNRKIDLFILPFLSLMYLFSGLDRGKSVVVCSLIEGNVGNAQTNGFTSDVGIPADALNNAVSLFFVTFVVFQPISAGIGKRVGPKYW